MSSKMWSFFFSSVTLHLNIDGASNRSFERHFLPLFRVNNYNLAVQGWDLDEGVEHGPAEVGGRDDLNRCNNALNQMVVDLDSSVLDRDPAAAAVLRAPTSNDAGLNKPGLVLTGNGKKKSAIS